MTNFFKNFHGSYESRIRILRKFIYTLKSQVTESTSTMIETQITEIEHLIIKYKKIMRIRSEKIRALKLKREAEARRRAALAEKKRQEEEAARLEAER
jgi:hypothetical protein